MADSTKQYAWYLEGNQLAILEKDVNFDNNVDNKEYGPGTSRQLWKSPQSTVENALEIKYVYSPTVRLITGGLSTDMTTSGTGAIYHMFGWTVVDGYLAFVFTVGADDYTDFSHSAYNEELGTAGTDYVYIQNSSRWNGLHKLKTRGSKGMIITDTRVSTPSAITATGIDVTASTAVFDDDGLGDIALLFPSTSETYYWMLDEGSSGNMAIFKGTSDGMQNLTASHVITLKTSGGSSTVNTYEEAVAIGSDIMDETNATGSLYKIYKDNLTLYGANSFERLEDESFELDLPNYLQKALVYYVKAKMAEDAGAFELREFALREFKKMVEKYETSRISGPRMVFPGAHGIR